MRYYENLFIVHPNYEQEKLTHTIESAKKEIANLNGNVLVVEEWGKRRLAYPIDKQKYGSYILIQYESENQKVNLELEAWMKLRAEILSYMTVTLDGKPEPRSTDASEANRNDEN
ncbi:30S ribosomal protein S6 [bacterium]|nr:30S ribosomal protein S6 [bacterium]MBU1065000.1 30S ribosomal protein S6 [bacterium]MBU1634976.1 30S ribosomal protein S6 [bacterium]MBU1872768.1 30S ribosomal protein S6 [bacterium]